MDNYMLLIPIGVVLIFIIIIIIYLVKRSKNNDEQPSSILDVNEVGVPSSSDFSYGYEKEETVVMNPINVNNEEPTDLKQTEESSTENNFEDVVKTDIEDSIDSKDTNMQEDSVQNDVVDNANELKDINVQEDVENNNESEEM